MTPIISSVAQAVDIIYTWRNTPMRFCSNGTNDIVFFARQKRAGFKILRRGIYIIHGTSSNLGLLAAINTLLK